MPVKRAGLQQLVRVQGEDSKAIGRDSGGVLNKDGKVRIGERYESKNQQ